MYNRYTPQADGTYRRIRIHEQPNQNPNQTFHPNQGTASNKSQSTATGKPDCVTSNNDVSKKSLPKTEQARTVASFFNNLLPKNLDTGDLLVIILLLLMSGDCQEDQNTALLTLALYLFM